MITGLLLFIYIIILAWLCGALTHLLLAGKKSIELVHPSVTILLGLVSLAALLQPMHFFIPARAMAHFSIDLLVVILFFCKREQLKTYWIQQQTSFVNSIPYWWLFPALIAIALINLIGRAGVGDIADYHLQAIQWDAEFPVVKGLGNLRRQLGNNSSWFLLHAFSGFGFLGLQSVYVLNTLMLFIAVWYFYPLQNQRFTVLNSVVLLYLALMAFRKYVGAVTNDYAITIFTFVLLSEWLTSHQQHQRRWMIVFMAMTLPAFKLSSLAMLVLPVIYVLSNLKKPERRIEIILLLAAMLFFYLPWFVTSWFKSGYLIYPIEQSAFGQPDWQMHASTLSYERTINMANERVPGMATMDVMQLGFSSWFPRWLVGIDAFSKLLLLLFITLPVVALIQWLRKNKFHTIETSSRILVPLLAVALPLWLFNAPAMRFMFGYMVFSVAWFAEILSGNSIRQWTIKWLTPVLLLILLSGAVLFWRQYIPIERLGASMVQPLKYGNNKMNRVNLQQGYVLVPDSAEQCWDAPLPATSIIDSTLHWRSTELADGFSVKP